MPTVKLDYSLSPLDALASTSRRERSDSIRRQRKDPTRTGMRQDSQSGGDDGFGQEMRRGGSQNGRVERGGSGIANGERTARQTTSRPSSPPYGPPPIRSSPRSDLQTSPIISRHAFSSSTVSLSVDQDQQSIYSEMQDGSDQHHPDPFVSSPKNNHFSNSNPSPQLRSFEPQTSTLSSRRVEKEREMVLPALRRNPSVRGYPNDLTPNAETESLAADRSTWYSMNGANYAEEGAKMEAEIRERDESNRVHDYSQYEDAESPIANQFEPIRSPNPQFDQQVRSPSTESIYTDSQQPIYSPVASPSRPSRARSLTQSKNFSRPSAPVISSVLYEEREDVVTSSQGYESTTRDRSRSSSGNSRPLQIQTIDHSHKQYHADSLASPTFLGSFNRPLPPSPSSSSNRYQQTSQPASPSSFSPSNPLQITPMRSSSLQSSPRRSLSNSITRSFKGDDSPKASASLSRSGSASVSRSGSKKKGGWAAFFGAASKGEKEKRQEMFERRDSDPARLPPTITLSRQNSVPNAYDQDRRDSLERMKLWPSVAKAVATRFVPNGKASPTEWTTSRLVAEEEDVILEIGMGRIKLPQRSVSDNGPPRQQTDSVYSNYSIYSLPPDDTSRLNSPQPRSPLSSSFPTTISQISPSPSQQSIERSHPTHS